jgi:hypothetical protein
VLPVALKNLYMKEIVCGWGCGVEGVGPYLSICEAVLHIIRDWKHVEAHSYCETIQNKWKDAMR